MNGGCQRPFERVLIIMFENMYRSYVMKNEYMKCLADQGIDMLNFFGVMHPSQTNYIASIAGELCKVTDDERPDPLPQRTIVDLIEESPLGISWKAYMESYVPQQTPWQPCLVPSDQFPYMIKHDPFSSFANILGSQARWEHIVNEAQFFEDAATGNLPQYAWFTPNMWNDGHYTAGLQKGPCERAPALVDQLAKWLQYFFGVLNFPGPDSSIQKGTLVVVTFDESDFEADWEKGKKYTYDGPNQIYTVLLGDMIKPGVEEEGCNHYSLIKTIEQNFRLNSLGKNDQYSNWLQFLWGKRFEWGSPQETPLEAVGALAAAEFHGLLYAAYRNASGNLCCRSFDGQAWSGESTLVQSAGEQVALAVCGDQLHLVYKSADGLSALTCTAGSGWSKQPQQVVADPAGHIALAACNAGANLMLAWQGEGGALFSLVFASGAWAGTPTPVGPDTDPFKTDGPICLGVIGPSLYLIHKVVGGNGMNVVSYNTADFNLVTLAEGEWSGPYDDTTKNAWSPSGFPVAHFSHAANPVTPGEEEPLTEPYSAAGPLAAATLDGVIHLAHSGGDGPGILTETFSISGIMTPKLPVSYNASDKTTTSNGYGTLAEAGWSDQAAIEGAANRLGGAMAMASAGSQLVLLSQPGDGPGVKICLGRYA